MDDPQGWRRTAVQCMSNAEQRLIARDFEGCKQLVARAVCFFRLSPGAEALFAVAAALHADERRGLPSAPPDPYAVLGLCSDVPSARDPAAIESKYRRVSLLLNRPSTPHPACPLDLAFADAARLVDEAWGFLSDPLRKAALDSNLDAAAALADAAATAKATAVAAAARVSTTAAPSPEGQSQPRPEPIAPSPPRAPQPPTNGKNPKAMNQSPEPVQVDGQSNAEEDNGVRRSKRASKPKPKFIGPGRKKRRCIHGHSVLKKCQMDLEQALS